MRFLFVDRILDVTPGKSLLASKAIPIMDGYLNAHYPGQPVVPATITAECFAQAGGWLNLISREFRVKAVLALIEGLKIRRDVQPGETLFVEVRMEYLHVTGATLRGEARVGRQVAATLDRLVFAHQWTTEAAFAYEQRERFNTLYKPLDDLPGQVGNPSMFLSID
jgi:3-hydroxymyristoyl/3-hydroxydecanoyl-(acyl carrier protein) dehydratase